jgi:hypothetical protein
MLKALSLFLVLIQLTSVARSEVALPVISISNFVPGRSWTWDYFQTDGTIWSTERYTVLSRTDQVVLIEISSDYAGGQNLKPNTRLEVDVSQCLLAYAKSNEKRGWMFKMYSLNGSAWSPYEPNNTAAFEEKFNCNPREYLKTSDQYLTVYSTIRGTPAFQQKLWRRLNASWFAKEGTNKAVAIHKEFLSDPTQTYRFQLR